LQLKVAICRTAGYEIDLLLELAKSVFPIEVKAGETITPDFLRGLRAFARIYDRPPPNGGALVYAGDAEQSRHGTVVVPYTGLPALLEALAGCARSLRRLHTPPILPPHLEQRMRDLTQ
jgi:hypothetical protein